MKNRFDVENWNRKTAYYYFKDFKNPFAHLGVDIDITALYVYVKANGYSLNLANTYIATRLGNEIENFRLRIEEDEIYIYDVVHAGQTIGYEDGTYTNINMSMKRTLKEFDACERTHIIAHKKKHEHESGPNEGDLLFMTTIPWVSFTSFQQPNNGTASSNPKVAFGKVKDINGHKMLPLCVEGHHSLMDGYQLSLFINGFEHYAANPELLDEAFSLK